MATAERRDLREFLISRRARLSPEQVGLDPGDGQRRVPGLRREELARLVGVSVDYYMRLEQGRPVNVSEQVLESISRVLRLDETERSHLFNLARPTHAHRRASVSRAQRLRPEVRTLLDSLVTPAFVLGRRMDVLATNQLARALICDFDALPAQRRNMARWSFLDPAARELYPDWEAIARQNVAVLRAQAGRYPDDTDLSALVGELTVKSKEFASWWTEHAVHSRTHGVKRYHHPVVGDLSVSYEVLHLASDPEHTLFIYTVEPGSPDEDALRLLASWTSQPPTRTGAPHPPNSP